MVQAAKQRAKQKRLKFNITESDLELPAVCPVFEVPMIQGTRMAASLDRIDSSKGYVKGNVQIISRLANLMKQDANQKQLEQFANWIIKTKT